MRRIPKLESVALREWLANQPKHFRSGETYFYELLLSSFYKGQRSALNRIWTKPTGGKQLVNRLNDCPTVFLAMVMNAPIDIAEKALLTRLSFEGVSGRDGFTFYSKKFTWQSTFYLLSYNRTLHHEWSQIREFRYGFYDMMCQLHLANLSRKEWKQLQRLYSMCPKFFATLKEYTAITHNMTFNKYLHDLPVGSEKSYRHLREVLRDSLFYMKDYSLRMHWDGVLDNTRQIKTRLADDLAIYIAMRNGCSYEKAVETAIAEVIKSGDKKAPWVEYAGRKFSWNGTLYMIKHEMARGDVFRLGLYSILEDPDWAMNVYTEYSEDIQLFLAHYCPEVLEYA